MNIYNNESRLYRFENDEDLDDFFRKQTCINVDICRKAENLKDFADAVKSTVYYDSLIRAESVNADYFSVAMTLDGLYYELFWKSINKNLPKDEQIAMKKYIGSIVDMLNITWIYRGKKYFGFDSKLIYTYILPVRYKIGEEMLTKLVECENAENIKDIMKNMPYKHLFDKVDEGYFIEENYRKLRYGLAKNLFRNHSNSTAGVFAYFILKETEILNITRVIEGIRYAINPDLIKKHIKI